jgi:phosphoribosyl 1,2-cyclic phosphodiesterase/CheY-like chemotaxis protein
VKTVLIIDDDPGFRSVLGETLQENGWQVLEAGEGDEGIRMARMHRPEAILCDLLMPRRNGFHVCRSLRSDAELRHAKIIITSGRDYDSDRLAAFEAGADDYLTKPVEPGQLLRLLAQIPSAPWFNGAAAAAGQADSQVYFKFWGVRGSIATPGPATVGYGGNTSCVEVRADGQIIILDAGTGLRPLGKALTEEFGGQALDLTLLLSHTHWDHIQGLPFFMPVYQSQNHLRILGYEGARHGLDSVLSGQMESPFFPIGLSEVPANILIEELMEMQFHIGPVIVEARFANHPGICVGYRLVTSRGTIAFFPDFEPYQAHRHGVDSRTSDAGQFDYAREEAAKLVEFLRGTDVLIMDSQFDREEYEQHIGWGHACVDDVVEIALEADVKKLFLFHHDPEHDDAKISAMATHARNLVAARNGALEVNAAREGVTISLAARALA